VSPKAYRRATKNAKAYRRSKFQRNRSRNNTGAETNVNCTLDPFTSHPFTSHPFTSFVEDVDYCGPLTPDDISVDDNSYSSFTSHVPFSDYAQDVSNTPPDLFENTAEVQKVDYVNRCQRLFEKNIRSYDKLKHALESLKTMQRGPCMHVFALRKPKVVKDSREIKQVKQYWVGTHSRFWQYASDETHPVFSKSVLYLQYQCLYFSIWR
jgi:hypothetical protein